MRGLRVERARALARRGGTPVRAAATRGLALLLLVGCDRGAMTGDWTVTLSCDAAFDGVPACPGDAAALVRLWSPDDDRAGLAAGEHRTLFPGNVDGDGSATGVAGLVATSWSGGDLLWDLSGYADDPLASAADLAAWGDHRLRLAGRPAQRCWSATWTWLTDDGDVAAEGEAQATRRGRSCDW